MLREFRKGQSTLEYALIIAVVAGALIAMQVYIKRGVQGKLKATADEIGEQYSPGYTTSNTVTVTGTTTNESLAGGVTSSSSVTTQSRDETYDVSEAENEYWPE